MKIAIHIRKLSFTDTTIKMNHFTLKDPLFVSFHSKYNSTFLKSLGFPYLTMFQPPHV